MLALMLVLIAAVLSSTSRIGPTGMGPIVFGMTPEQADATGVPLIHGTPDRGSSCYYLSPESVPGIHFMVEEGTLRRVDDTSPFVRTVDGFRVGDDGDKVIQFYGHRADVAPNKYDAKWKTIEVAPQGPDADRFRTIFLVNRDGHVAEISAGVLPQVQYVEHCG